jgi:hypothetical protein
VRPSDVPVVPLLYQPATKPKPTTRHVLPPAFRNPEPVKLSEVDVSLVF